MKIQFSLTQLILSSIFLVVFVFSLAKLGLIRDVNPARLRLATERNLSDLGWIMEEYVRVNNRLFFDSSGEIDFAGLAASSGRSPDEIKGLLYFPTRSQTFRKNNEFDVYCNRFLNVDDFYSEDRSLLLFSKPVDFGDDFVAFCISVQNDGRKNFRVNEYETYISWLENTKKGIGLSESEFIAAGIDDSGL